MGDSVPAKWPRLGERRSIAEVHRELSDVGGFAGTEPRPKKKPKTRMIAPNVEREDESHPDDKPGGLKEFRAGDAKGNIPHAMAHGCRAVYL